MVINTDVFIVDDSAVVRQYLTRELNKIGGIQVIGSATDPILAQRKFALKWPQVIILDIEMPRMDGLTFLKKIMHERPTPVIMWSRFTQANSPAALEALRLGALEVAEKPSILKMENFSTAAKPLLDCLDVASSVNLKALRPIDDQLNEKLSNDLEQQQSQQRIETADLSGKLIAIGASVGGTKAVETILTRLPSRTPPIVIVLHMPEKFTHAYAERLNNLCQFAVKEAQNRETLEPCTVYIAPGNHHMTINGRNHRLKIDISDGPPINGYRPSVDHLFDSISNLSKVETMGIILTGMGEDGARGLGNMRRNGAVTLGQSENTCVVYGMPGAAKRRNAVSLEASPMTIASHIIAFTHRKPPLY